MTIEQAILGELVSDQPRTIESVVNAALAKAYHDVTKTQVQIELRGLVVQGKVNILRDWKIQKA